MYATELTAETWWIRLYETATVEVSSKITSGGGTLEFFGLLIVKKRSSGVGIVGNVAIL